MKSITQELLAVRAMLHKVAEHVDRMALLDDDTPKSRDMRSVLALAALLFHSAKPRTVADTLRFGEAVRAGDGGWLLLKSVPGECRADAWHFAQLPKEVRNTLGV